MSSHLKIAEYTEPLFAGVQAPIGPPTVEQTVIDFTDGQPHQSAAFQLTTRLIEVSTTANCAVLCGGQNPVASVNSQFIPAGGLRVYSVRPGDKLSVIADS
jgi:hypothetical protein